jgi:hypothetical protein
MNVQVIEVVVKCCVPRDEVDDYIYRFRNGEAVVGIPEGLACKDAFEAGMAEDPESVIIRAGYGPKSFY